jgi:hypothetical protein
MGVSKILREFAQKNTRDMLKNIRYDLCRVEHALKQRSVKRREITVMDTTGTIHEFMGTGYTIDSDFTPEPVLHVYDGANSLANFPKWIWVKIEPDEESRI